MDGGIVVFWEERMRLPNWNSPNHPRSCLRSQKGQRQHEEDTMPGRPDHGCFQEKRKVGMVRWPHRCHACLESLHSYTRTQDFPTRMLQPGQGGVGGRGFLLRPFWDQGINFIPFPELALTWGIRAPLPQWGARDGWWLRRPAWGRGIGGLSKAWSRERCWSRKKASLGLSPHHTCYIPGANNVPALSEPSRVGFFCDSPL